MKKIILMWKNFKKSIITNHLLKYPTPISLNFAWSFGALTGLFLTIQMITGVLLGLYYDAGENAFESVQHIIRDVPYGWLLKYLHSNSASFYFLCMYLRIARSIFFKSYLTPREYAWGSGVFILLWSIITAFLGYILPWGQMSYWAATVIVRLLTVIPNVGPEMVEWLWGNFAVASLTLIRIYQAHFASAIFLCIFVIRHIRVVHSRGSYAQKGLEAAKDTEYFNPFFSSKDILIVLFVLFIFMYIVCFHPNLLSHPDNLIKADPFVTPKHIVPEWYFSPFYAILRSFESKILGVFMLLMSVLVLLVLPYCKESVKEDSFTWGFFANWFFYIFTVNFAVLGFIGSRPAEFPYIQIGQFHSFVYFGSILLLYFVCKIKNRMIVLMAEEGNKESMTNNLNETKMKLKNWIILLDIVEEFTFMEKWETVKANPHYAEDLFMLFVASVVAFYFFFSSNKFCLKALFIRVFFFTVKFQIGEKLNSNLSSFVSIWYFYILTLYIFISNMKGLSVYSTTYVTYLQLPFSISFLGFCLAFFVAWGEYNFRLLGGFMPYLTPGVALFLYFVEFLSFCMRLLSLAGRLFINILAGHVLLKLFGEYTGYLFVYLYMSVAETCLTYIVCFVFFILEYLAAFLQAAVLSSLVAIYINECLKFASNH